ncbi:MAG: diguanylate cyclase [Phycisphaerales bacterium JB063]
MMPGTSNPAASQPIDATPRPSAGCVLVVRSDDLRERVGAALSAVGLSEVTIESSPSYLSAMGRLVIVKPDVILGPVSAMTGMVASTARALRKLSPDARLVALAQAHEQDEADAARDAGFDQCLFEPADATQLLMALGITAEQASAATFEPDTTPPTEQDLDAPEPAPAQPPAAGTASAVALEAFPPVLDDAGEVHDAFGLHEVPEAFRQGEALEPHAADDRVTNDALLAPGRLDRSADAPAQPPSEHAPDDTEVAVPLGDVDLVESLMQDCCSMPRQAERLLVQQSGIAGVALAPSADRVPPGHAVVAVQHNAQQLGLLHAPPPATPQQLTPWADWLARWLALEKHVAQLERQAMTDELTGVWNRRYFQQFLEERLRAAGRERQQVTLLVFDIDNFKQYNDNYGHPAGDDILRETARLIQSLVRDHDVVARIGGDEFAVVFWDKGEPRHLGSQHPDNVLGIARRFQKAISEHKFPKLGTEAVGTLTVSGGLAGFPWDGRTPEELIAQADAMAIQSKRKGKNAVCFGPACAPTHNGGENSNGEHPAPARQGDRDTCGDA